MGRRPGSGPAPSQEVTLQTPDAAALGVGVPRLFVYGSNKLQICLQFVCSQVLEMRLGVGAPRQ